MESCPSCGKDSPANSLHCVHCGAKLASAAQKTQFGMPVLRPGGDVQTQSAEDGEKSTAEYAPQDLARLAMATKKTPGSALAGLGSLKTGRRPGSLLQGLPQFRGAGQSPLTSGEFRLGGVGKDDAEKPELGLYAAAKRSSLPPEVAPSTSAPPVDDGQQTVEEPPPTVAMQGLTAAQVGQAEPAATVAMQGVTDTALDSHAARVLLGAASADPNAGATVEERSVEPAAAPVKASASEAPREAATSEPPLPEAMRGSERAHHPSGSKGVQQARIDAPGGGNAKWIVIALVVAVGVGIAIWLSQG